MSDGKRLKIDYVKVRNSGGFVDDAMSGGFTTPCGQHMSRKELLQCQTANRGVDNVCDVCGGRRP